MATLYPDTLPGDASPSEKPVYRALSQLPDRWRVFHSVAWQSVRKGRQGDGEADFVLLHPARGLIVIEAKGGSIRLENGEWFSVGRGGKHPINPFEQAVASKHALVGFLRDSIPDLPWLEAGHGVWFPEVTMSGSLSAQAPYAIVLDSGDLRRPVAAVNDLVNHWGLHGELQPADVDAITERLAPTVTVRHTLADDVAEVRARQRPLWRPIHSKDFCASRVSVCGSPGSGCPHSVRTTHRSTVDVTPN